MPDFDSLRSRTQLDPTRGHERATSFHPRDRRSILLPSTPFRNPISVRSCMVGCTAIFRVNFTKRSKTAGFARWCSWGPASLRPFFTMTTVVAAAAVWRTQPRFGALPLGPITGYLAAISCLKPGSGSILYGLFLTPLVRFASARTQIRIAVMLALLALAYPALRTLDLIPTTLVDTAALSASTVHCPCKRGSIKNDS